MKIIQTMANQRPSTAPFPFPCLPPPPELRNAIYALVIPTTARLRPSCPPDDQSRSSWALAHVSRLIRDEFTTLFYSTAHLLIPLPITCTSNLTSAYHNWLNNTDEALLGLVQHLVLETEIEVQRLIKWHMLPHELNIGCFMMRRKLQRAKIKLDRANGSIGFGVRGQGMEKRRELTVLSRTTRLDERWVSSCFTREHGLSRDGAVWGQDSSVEYVAVAVREALEPEKAPSGNAGLGKEELNRVIATMWRCGGMACGVVPGEMSVGSEGVELLIRAHEYSRNELTLDRECHG